MLKYLKTVKINSPKVRLGRESDGGYVMSEVVLKECVALFTYGYGGDKTYEDDFIQKYNKPNYLFDHTVGQEAWTQGIQYFYPEGLGTALPNSHKIEEWFKELEIRKKILSDSFDNLEKNVEFSNILDCQRSIGIVAETIRNLSHEFNLKDVKEHYTRFGIQGDIFLKIDTEGAEYDYFSNVDIDDLSSYVCGLIVEVHWIESEENQKKFSKMMEKINKHFVLTHVHGNNWGGEFNYDGHLVPRVVELSLVNKRYVTELSDDDSSYPTEGLDFPNNPNAADCNLGFIKLI